MNKKLFIILAVVLSVVTLLSGVGLIVLGVQVSTLQTEIVGLSDEKNGLADKYSSLSDQYTDLIKQNIGLNDKNTNLNNQIGDLNDKIDDLESIVDDYENRNYAIVTYQAEGLEWKYEVVEKGSSVTLPKYETKDAIYSGWKKDGAGETFYSNCIFDNFGFPVHTPQSLLTTYPKR